MAAEGVIEKGVFAVGDGTFKVKRPTVNIPEVLYLHTRAQERSLIGKVFQPGHLILLLIGLWMREMGKYMM